MLIIFDKDGVLVEPIEGEFINHASNQKLRAGVEDMVKFLKSKNITLAIASNQGGVAMGKMSLTDANEILQSVADQLNIDHWLLCPYHPDGTVKEFSRDSDMRKPAPGMLTELMGITESKPNETIFVGDMDTDRQAAKAANVTYFDINDFEKMLSFRNTFLT